jgi:hypothetical protein
MRSRQSLKTAELHWDSLTTLDMDFKMLGPTGYSKRFFLEVLGAEMHTKVWPKAGPQNHDQGRNRTGMIPAWYAGVVCDSCVVCGNDSRVVCGYPVSTTSNGLTYLKSTKWPNSRIKDGCSFYFHQYHDMRNIQQSSFGMGGVV